MAGLRGYDASGVEGGLPAGDERHQPPDEARLRADRGTRTQPPSGVD